MTGYILKAREHQTLMYSPPFVVSSQIAMSTPAGDS